MRVTVCLAVYNGEQAIGRALDSVFAQTYRDFEVLVLDDGSTDRSADIARRYDVKLIRVPNSGVGAARRRMMEEASGELVAFIDHDDEWLPDKLALQVPILDSTGAVLVHTDGWYVFENGESVQRNLAIQTGSSSFEHVLPGNRVIASSTVFRRDAMLRAGNFGSDMIRCSDWHAWLMLAPLGEFVHLPRRLVRYYVRSTSLANSGYAFHEAQHSLLTDKILPRRDELFARLDSHERMRYTHMIVRDVGVALSAMAKYKDRQGDRRAARALHLQAIRAAPDVLRVWTRAFRAFLL